jgi:hypothetical protein
MNGAHGAAGAGVVPVRSVGAIVSPTLDALLGGGASLIAIAVIFVLPTHVASSWWAQAFLPLSVLLNWPHFAASYHLLYTMPGAAAKHPFATKYVPVLLIAYATVAILVYSRAPILLQAFHSVAAMYLAWHYTGQAWGAMATFAHTEGLRFDALARRLIGANLIALLAWHATWSANLIHRMIGPSLFNPIYAVVSAVAVASAVAGLAGLWRMRRLEGRLPARVWLPWLAIHAWYAMFYRGELFWVQLVQMSHAAQYLGFPARVVANREEQGSGLPWTARRAATYAGLLVGTGVFAFWLLPKAADVLATWSSVPLKEGVAGLIVGDILVIHHYFVDGCIWKLGDREVRRDLFWHLSGSKTERTEGTF